MLSQPELDAIVKHHKDMPPAQRNRTNHFDFDLPGKPTLFVKYGDSDLLNEASTQSFFYDLAQKDSSAPRIPAVYSAFCGRGYYFIVMEKINLPTLSDCDSILEDDAIERVASAIKWLFDQKPSIPSTTFGRISNRKACVWHRFFKDHQAPVPFVNTEAITKYINKALSRRPRNSLSISLPDELSIYHSDVRKDNFLIDVTTKRICVVDFQHIGVLPKPFQEYGFFSVGISFAADVGDHLGLQRSDIADTMAKASVILQQSGGDAHLGLNEFGERHPIK